MLVGVALRISARLELLIVKAWCCAWYDLAFFFSFHISCFFYFVLGCSFAVSVFLALVVASN